MFRKDKIHMDEMEKMLKDLENNINFEELDKEWISNLEKLDEMWSDNFEELSEDWGRKLENLCNDTFDID